MAILPKEVEEAFSLSKTYSLKEDETKPNVLI